MNIFTNFVSLPKFAQISNWWRHTRRSVHFQSSRPLFLDSAFIFTSEIVTLNFHWLRIFVFLELFLQKVITLECSYFTVFPQWRHHLSSPPTIIFWHENSQTLKEHNFVKKIFLMRFFFVCLEILSRMQKCNKIRG